MNIGEVGERLRRSTVQVRSSGRQRAGTGSGVIWDSTGSIVTNGHVLGDGDHSVELWDGRILPAQIESRDDRRDLARLKIHTIGIDAIKAREAAPRPGEVVVAVGNPLGFTGALTTGVVHAVGPVARLGRRSWVQATVRLAPGNSGGPLADAAGQLVGINAMIVSGGIALAIPTSVVLSFLRDGAGPMLGVSVQAVNLGNRGIGLLVMSVEQGSPAETASLLIGDILISANQNGFASPADLGDLINETGRGILKLRFLRGGQPREREVAVSLAGSFQRQAA